MVNAKWDHLPRQPCRTTFRSDLGGSWEHTRSLRLHDRLTLGSYPVPGPQRRLPSRPPNGAGRWAADRVPLR